MRNRFSALFFCIGMILSAGFVQYAKASTKYEPVEVSTTGIHFDFASQDGELNYTCSSVLLPASTDLAVTCSRADASQDIWKFTVHVRLFRHERTSAPKLSYELLYWVTDEQLPGGQMGQFVGSTIWFNFAEATPLMSLDASQDIENTMVLRLHIDL